MALFWKRKEQPPEFVTAAPGSPPDLLGNQPPAFVPPAEESSETGGSGTAEAVPEPPPPAEVSKKPGLFGRVKTALAERLQKTKEDFVGQFRAAIKAAGTVDEHLLDRIEEVLIKADLGAETTMKIVEEMREFEARGASPDDLLKSFKSQLLAILGKNERTLSLSAPPCVILVIGVNGVGKTTTIGKLAAEFQDAGKKTLLVAGDTFRAAAVEQLQIWADRTGASFLSREMGADAAGLAFDGVKQAIADGVDVVLIDTAGRLHTKTNLMEELKKIARVLEKILPGAPHEVLLVLDATTGQNAIQQARVFTEAVPVTALAMTKLDGTAKGGVLIGIRNLFDIPVVKIGVGESVEDLRDFKAQEFVDALFEE